MSIPTVEVLTRARALVEKKWGQGYRADRPGTYCMLEAICKVRSLQIGQTDIAGNTLAGQLLGAAIGEGSIVGWNDDTERTHAEVLAAYDKAIKLAGGQQ